MKKFKKIFHITIVNFCTICYGISTDNSKTNLQHIIIDSPEAVESKAPKFTGLDVSFLKDRITQDAVEVYKRQIEKLNPQHTNIWHRKLWNLDYYKEKNLPIIVGTLQNTQIFSSQYKKLGLRFLDLPIYMPDQGWRIPKELEQFKEVIKMTVDHERLCLPDFEKNHYVYITVDQGLVEPHTSQRRAGWHGDSYRKINSKKRLPHILVDHVYVIYDNCPTLFMEGPFSLDTIDPENISAVLEQFAQCAKNKQPLIYPNYTLLRLDPYCVHDAGINTSDKPLYRTFVKLSFSKVKYAHLGNAHNNLFTYDWPMTPRNNVPYTKEAITLSAHRKDRDQFIEVDPSEIDFLHKKSNVPWACSQVYTVVKMGEIYAEPAQEGDLLESKNDNFIITINVAQKGNYKITFAPGDSGFMNSKKFEEIYSPNPNNKNLFFPKKILRRAVTLTKDVRMKAPWGTLHYATAGDYLVYIHDTETYFVPKKIFEKDYEILD